MPRSPLTDAMKVAESRLASRPVGGYHPGGEAATEPTAWATIALAECERFEAARVGATWLAERQARDGSVGVTVSQSTPAWTTALAILAWRRVDATLYAGRIDAAARWAFNQEPWTRERDALFGHDTMLSGWSWAPDTHSWVEPTAFFAVALRDRVHADSPRRGEAVRLLVDRLLPDGGANYGNTTVFGQQLLQHVQTSGVVAWVLADESIEDARLARTLDYLEASLAEPSGTASTAWSVRGLAAHNRGGGAAHEALLKAWPRVRDSGSLHKTALFALAAQALASNTINDTSVDS